jgi:hypothetical protein
MKADRRVEKGRKLALEEERNPQNFTRGIILKRD